MRVYFLTIGSKGNRLKRTGEAVGPGTSMHDGKGLLAATQIDMGMLARELGGVLGVPVIDKTGLDGAYDIKLEWTPEADEPESVSSSSPSIFNAVQEQLGLKLESGRGPVETLVVEYAEKASAN